MSVRRTRAVILVAAFGAMLLATVVTLGRCVARPGQRQRAMPRWCSDVPVDPRPGGLLMSA